MKNKKEFTNKECKHILIPKKMAVSEFLDEYNQIQETIFEYYECCKCGKKVIRGKLKKDIKIN